MEYVYKNGLVTCRILEDEEINKYKNMLPSVTQTKDMIRIVGENESEKQILEFTVNELRRIKIQK